jgi:hypothetical protein
MQDKPSAEELLVAIQDFLMKEILPAIKSDDLLAYKTLVSWNMLGIISREIQSSNLNQLLSQSKSRDTELAERIRIEKFSIKDREIWEEVKNSLREKLEVANPKILG